MNPDLLRDQTLIRTALTVRLAWDLHRLRIKARSEVLQELRAHVLLSLPEPVSLAEMERLSEFFLLDYLDRVRNRRYRPITVEPCADLPIANSWRLSIEAACDPLALAVFRLRYGDAVSAQAVARMSGSDVSEVLAAIEGLREIMRLEAVAHGVEESLLTPAVVDRLLSRAAAASGDDCPMPENLVILATGVRGESDSTLVQHARACPRCARAIRLLRAGVLTARELMAPPDFPEYPPTLQLVALHVHPQARRHRRTLLEALGQGARSVGDDSILVDATRSPEWDQALIRRVRLGQPAREHIRGVLVSAPGLLGARCILGPAPVLALETSRSRPWGEVEGIGDLPEPLPPPLNVARLWSSAIVAGLLAFAVGLLVLLQSGSRVHHPIEALPSWTEGDLAVRFDVDDMAYLDVFAVGSGGVTVKLECATPADKAALSTGEGDFWVDASGSAIILVSEDERMIGLKDAVVGSTDTRAGQREIKKRIRSRYPNADVAIFPAYPPS